MNRALPRRETARPDPLARRFARALPAVHLPALLLSAALFAWGMGLTIAHDFGMADESWFLRVCQRVVQGDVLYRDIFYGTTPFSVYLSAAAVRLFGAEILVIKALVTLCFVATVLLSWRILRRLGASAVTAGLACLALLAYAGPQQSGVYNPLANVWLLATFSATLSWLHARAERAATAARRLGAASVMAGLCFATKQNIGVYTALALFATVALAALEEPLPWRRLPRDGALALAWFLLPIGVVLLPILLGGGWAQFVDYGFTNKRTYLRVGDIAYMDGVRAIGWFWRRLTPLTPQSAREFHTQVAYLLPLLLVPGLLFGALIRLGHIVSRRARRDRLVMQEPFAAGVQAVGDARKARRYRRTEACAVALFVGASFAGVYPRFDYYHVVYAIPAALVGLIYAWQRRGLFRIRGVRATLGMLALVWAGAGVALTSATAISRIRSDDFQWSTIPHFRGVRISRDEHTRIMVQAARLRAISAAEPTFLLTPYAAFFHLASGTDSLTPFDYPLVTAFGRSGMDEVRQALADGRITTVCLTVQPWSRLRPTALEEYVMQHFRADEDLELCRIYRAPEQAPGG